MRELRDMMSLLSNRLDVLGQDNPTSESRSLSPLPPVRRKEDKRKLLAISHSFKKTFHVSYIFIIKIYLLFNLLFIIFK